ncbi:MAG: HlyD family efflux transporter periplasmic adaptor subunit, partial [Muribaculaceae bacterium]|nr:HlyD family efflux transporter periplasmic adaptor subunit [Muribaculaceae bacterium]
ILVLQQKQLGSQQQSAKASSPDIAAQAAALRSQIAHQEHECQRFGRLLADGATTQKQYDDAQAQLGVLRGQLTALLSTLDNSRTSISDNTAAIRYQSEQIGEQIARSTVSSPLTGTVLIKYAQRGEFATPGRPLYKIADLDNIYLRAYFTVSQLADLRIGQKVTVIADFGGEEQYEYPGTVTWIAQESEFTPKSIQTRDSRANLVYAVKIAVRNDGRLKLGQYGEVRL